MCWNKYNWFQSRVRNSFLTSVSKSLPPSISSQLYSCDRDLHCSPLSTVDDHQYCSWTSLILLSCIPVQVVELESAYVLKQDVALHLLAEHSCRDALGRERQAGEEWLVTVEDTEMYIPEIGEVGMEEFVANLGEGAAHLSLKIFLCFIQPLKHKQQT